MSQDEEDFEFEEVDLSDSKVSDSDDSNEEYEVIVDENNGGLYALKFIPVKSEKSSQSYHSYAYYLLHDKLFWLLLTSAVAITALFTIIPFTTSLSIAAVGTLGTSILLGILSATTQFIGLAFYANKVAYVNASSILPNEKSIFSEFFNENRQENSAKRVQNINEDKLTISKTELGYIKNIFEQRNKFNKKHNKNTPKTHKSHKLIKQTKESQAVLSNAPKGHLYLYFWGEQHKDCSIRDEKKYGKQLFRSNSIY